MPTNSKRSTSNLTIQNNWRLINGPATITVPDFCLDSLAAFWCSVAYGVKLSYRKFRSIEIIARLPYQPWSSAAYTLLTVFLCRGIKSDPTVRHKPPRKDRPRQRNHACGCNISSDPTRPGIIHHTLIPMLFAFL